MHLTRALSTLLVTPLLATGAMTVTASDASAAECTTGYRYRVVATAGVYRDYDYDSNHLSGLIKYKEAGDIVGGINPAWTEVGRVVAVKLGTGGAAFMRYGKLDFLGGCA